MAEKQANPVPAPTQETMETLTVELAKKKGKNGASSSRLNSMTFKIKKYKSRVVHSRFC